MKRRYVLVGSVGCLLVTSCVNIKSVNTFSTSAAVSLQPSPVLPVTFESVYLQRTIDDSLSRHPFKRIPLVGIDFADKVSRDSLLSYRLADSLTHSGTVLLINYFNALAALSDVSTTFEPVQLKSPSFDAFLQQSAVKLTAAETIAFNRVLSVVGAAATGAYRRRELRNLLEQSHGDVRQMLGVLIFAHKRLADVVAISREQRYNAYKNGLIRDPSLTYMQKQDMARQWLQTSANTEQTRQAVLKQVTVLETIRKGYDTLYKNLDLLTCKDLIARINEYASTLQQLRSDLEQLKPAYGRLVP